MSDLSAISFRYYEFVYLQCCILRYFNSFFLFVCYRFTKPQTFADCIGNELPLGWEEAYDKHVGAYYINHVNQTTQLEDPRQEWRAIQEAMLRDYMQTAHDVLEKFNMHTLHVVLGYYQLN
ncbi:Protein WWC1 [Acromyrmex echinatior]|uniref:Protein WWC1 n=1 Tax=Acromyrmex echinatior TaxID=103372 RepID=F4WIE8_ACREC|nr:Protein WWC1 [Acromyrmex echinatior]